MEPLTQAERIAALLDGRLDERERARLLAELGASDDDLEILVNSASITRELEDEDRAAGAVPITVPRAREAAPGRVWWRRPSVMAGAAAAAVLLAIAPLVLRRGSSDAAFASPVADLANPRAGLPANWSLPWAETRGEGVRLGSRATSVRFGALATDMELAALSGDPAGFDSAAASAATLLRENGEPLFSGTYRRLSENELPRIDSLRHLHAETAAGLRVEMVELGAWAEAARVAAKLRDAAFFRSELSRRFVHDAVPAAQNSEDVAAALRAVRNAVSRGAVPDWPRLEPALAELLRSAG